VTAHSFDAASMAEKLTGHLGSGPLRPVDSRPVVDITNEAHAIEALLKVMRSGEIPSLYVRSGGLCWITTDKGNPVVHQLGADNLRAYFAEHLNTIAKVRSKSDDDWRDEPRLVQRQTCATILGRRTWPLPELHGIVTSPVLRPDGTILQTPGFDVDTGLFLQPRLPIERVPDAPTQEELTQARSLLVDQVLANFPFVRPSDRAQYIAGLLAPIIRPFVPGPTPLVAVTATSPGTGKSYLTEDMFGSLYGIGTMPWPENDAELRKAITTQLREGGEPVAAIDNVPSGFSIRSAILADLITKDTWRDRVLGATASVSMPNDRLWIVNGNNLRTGGDMSRRTLWVRLDAGCPNPDQRDVEQFAIGDLREWLRNRQNASALLRALLTLVSGWSAAGGPRRRINMGGFTAWASAVAGLLDWANIPGFQEDREETSVGLDEETEEWHSILNAWHDLWGDQPRPAKDALLNMDIAEFIPRVRGSELPAARQFGQWLGAREGRFYGPYRLAKVPDRHRKMILWKVEKRG
jgi:hypothetical protein